MRIRIMKRGGSWDGGFFNDPGKWIGDWATGKESLSDKFADTLADATEPVLGDYSDLAGLGSIGLYFVPGLGTGLAVEDFGRQAYRMMTNKKKNSLGDWAELALTGGAAIPVAGGIFKGLSKLFKAGSKTSKALTSASKVADKAGQMAMGTSLKGSLGRMAGAMGVMALSPSTSRPEYIKVGKQYLTQDEINNKKL